MTRAVYELLCTQNIGELYERYVVGSVAMTFSYTCL